MTPRKHPGWPAFVAHCRKANICLKNRADWGDWWSCFIDGWLAAQPKPAPKEQPKSTCRICGKPGARMIIVGGRAHKRCL